MDKNEFFTKRIRELANISFQRDIVTFSDFLNLNERNIVNSLDFRSSGVIVESFGGYDNAERQMVAFHSDALAYPWEYPIDCLRIRHTEVIVEKIENPAELPKPKMEPVSGTCASVRLDSLISLAFQSSRSSMVSFIEGGLVFVNGRLITSNGYEPKEGDIISVRGKGRFLYNGITGQTKKGRYSVRLLRYTS